MFAVGARTRVAGFGTSLSMAPMARQYRKSAASSARKTAPGSDGRDCNRAAIVSWAASWAPITAAMTCVQPTVCEWASVNNGASQDGRKEVVATRLGTPPSRSPTHRIEIAASVKDKGGNRVVKVIVALWRQLPGKQDLNRRGRHLQMIAYEICCNMKVSI